MERSQENNHRLKTVSFGAFRVFTACVHPVLVGDAERRILDAGVEEIVGTDSMPSHVGKVSLAPLIAEFLKAQESG